MTTEWSELTKLTQGRPIIIEKVRLADADVAIEGQFELPPLARFTMEDQVFVAAFVQTHGSIKQMEQIFGVSYPTIKNRLNRISEQMDFIRVETGSTSPRQDILDRLERGEISAKDALEALKK